MNRLIVFKSKENQSSCNLSQRRLRQVTLRGLLACIYFNNGNEINIHKSRLKINVFVIFIDILFMSAIDIILNILSSTVSDVPSQKLCEIT